MAIFWGGGEEMGLYNSVFPKATQDRERERERERENPQVLIGA